jgi:hypothetical protein
MSNQKLNLTRNQLASFLKDFEQIKQFEKLFQIADEVAPSSDTTGISIQAGNAHSAADLALNKIELLSQDIATLNAVNDNKTTFLLDKIESISKEISNNIASIDNKVNHAFAFIKQILKSIEELQIAPPPREFKRARYGQFYDTTTQTASAINTAKAITFNSTDISSGVYIGSPSSRIIVDTKGIYNFLFSIQLDKTAGGTGIFWVWPRINGIDVPNSNSQVQIQGNNAEQLVTVGYFFVLNPNDYVEIIFAVNDITVQVDSFPASVFYPAVPSIILTVSNNIQGVK